MSKEIENGIQRVYPADTDGREGELGLRLILDGEPSDEAWFKVDEVITKVRGHWEPMALSATLGARTSQEEGPRATFDAMLAQAARWMDGEFASPRKGGGPTVSIIHEAIARVDGCSVATAQRWYRQLNEFEKTFVQDRDDIIEAMTKLKAEREETHSLDSLLS